MSFFLKKYGNSQLSRMASFEFPSKFYVYQAIELVSLVKSSERRCFCSESYVYENPMTKVKGVSEGLMPSWKKLITQDLLALRLQAVICPVFRILLL